MQTEAAPYCRGSIANLEATLLILKLLLQLNQRNSTFKLLTGLYQAVQGASFIVKHGVIPVVLSGSCNHSLSASAPSPEITLLVLRDASLLGSSILKLNPFGKLWTFLVSVWYLPALQLFPVLSGCDVHRVRVGVVSWFAVGDYSVLHCCPWSFQCSHVTFLAGSTLIH